MYITINNQKGVGLVEVLIALLVFSIGMLGVASLQVVSKTTSFEAQQRQEAVLIASEIVSRMKNSGMTYSEIETAYEMTEFDSTQHSPTLVGLGDPPVTKDCDAYDSDCSQAQIAKWDIYQWQKAIAASTVHHGSGKQGLLKAKGSIAFASNVVTVTVKWESMTSMGARGKARKVEIKTFI